MWLVIAVLPRSRVLGGKGNGIDHCVAQRSNVIRAGRDLNDKLAFGQDLARIHIVDALDGNLVRFAALRGAFGLCNGRAELLESAGD